MTTITNITFSECNTFITVEADIDEGDSILHHLQLVDILSDIAVSSESLNIGPLMAIAAWLKSYCYSKQSIETIASMLVKSLIKLQYKQ